LQKVERLRAYYKERRNRKEVRIERAQDQSGAFSFEYNNERFEGVNPEMKSLMMYRTKTMDSLR